MTYCVGLAVREGLVLMSDTRTSSGVDNISTYRKMFTWEEPGDRVLTVMTAGNLATTQAVISEMEERGKLPDDRQNSMLGSPTMFTTARVIGRTLRRTIAERQSENQDKDSSRFNASLILAGQIAGMEPRMFMIYPEGNFIEATLDTPFFQIGELKYGRPILLRGYDYGMSFEAAVKLLMVSFDSTLKANLSVGMPLDLMLIGRDALSVTHRERIAWDHPYFQSVSTGWSEALKRAFDALPNYERAST